MGTVTAPVDNALQKLGFCYRENGRGSTFSALPLGPGSPPRVSSQAAHNPFLGKAPARSQQVKRLVISPQAASPVQILHPLAAPTHLPKRPVASSPSCLGLCGCDINTGFAFHGTGRPGPPSPKREPRRSRRPALPTKCERPSYDRGGGASLAHPGPLGQGPAPPPTAPHSPQSEQLRGATGSASLGRGRGFTSGGVRSRRRPGPAPCGPISVPANRAPFAPLFISVAVVHRHRLGTAVVRGERWLQPRIGAGGLLFS